MNENAYVLGFVKRAQEYGLSEYQAAQLIKQASTGEAIDHAIEKIREYGHHASDKAREYGHNISSTLKDKLISPTWSGRGLDDSDETLINLTGMPDRESALHALRQAVPLKHLLGTAWESYDDATKAKILSTLGGAAVGGGAGALVASRDKDGQTHRMRNALLGSLAGAGVGYGGAEYGVPAADRAAAKLQELLPAAREKLQHYS